MIDSFRQNEYYIKVLKNNTVQNIVSKKYSKKILTEIMVCGKIIKSSKEDKKRNRKILKKLQKSV